MRIGDVVFKNKTRFSMRDKALINYVKAIGYHYIATNDEGSTYAFKYKPVKTEGFWHPFFNKDFSVWLYYGLEADVEMPFCVDKKKKEKKRKWE